METACCVARLQDGIRGGLNETEETMLDGWVEAGCLFRKALGKGEGAVFRVTPPAFVFFQAGAQIVHGPRAGSAATAVGQD